MNIADHRRMRLQEKSKNLQPGALNYLIANYPDQGFVIDREEYAELFYHVRRPTDKDTVLESLLADRCRYPIELNGEDSQLLAYINSAALSKAEEGNEKSDKATAKAAPKKRARKAPARKPKAGSKPAKT